MKATVIYQTYVNDKTMPGPYRDQISYVKDTRKNCNVAVFAVGAIIDGPLSVQMCRNGQASPIDDECREAVNLTADQLATLQLENEIAEKGVRQEDRELYIKGVIDGYDAEGNYKPGANWDAYQAAMIENEEEDV